MRRSRKVKILATIGPASSDEAMLKNQLATIVSGWAERIQADRARALGFKAETSFDDIVRAHIEDELGGKIAN